jgi:hypothetical protein
MESKGIAQVGVDKFSPASRQAPHDPLKSTMSMFLCSMQATGCMCVSPPQWLAQIAGGYARKRIGGPITNNNEVIESDKK